MEDIEAGLKALVEVVKRLGIHSIAIPPLGCGRGGLDWAEVRPRIEVAFRYLSGIEVFLFKPQGAPEADNMLVATKRAAMSPGQAALIGLFERYILPGYRLTLLEIQKLAYFLQAAGEPLKLNFSKGKYGPYAETLHHVLQRMEGHFIRGYGDRSRYATICLLSGATDEANSFLQSHKETIERLNRVARLIETVLNLPMEWSFYQQFIGLPRKPLKLKKTAALPSKALRHGGNTKNKPSILST